MLKTLQLINKDPVSNSVMASTLASIEITCHSHVTPLEFLASTSPPSPTCLLVDMTMPEMSPLQLLANARRRGYLHPILFTAHRVEIDSVIRLLRHGAFGFLQKPVNQMSLMENIQAALDLDRQSGPRLQRAWQLQKRLGELSRREREVFEKIASGQTATQVAHDLGISRRTVENQRLSAYRKLEIKGAAEAIRRWSELDLLNALGALNLWWD
jgi:FixJ family two-component response regulator